MLSCYDDFLCLCASAYQQQVYVAKRMDVAQTEIYGSAKRSDILSRPGSIPVFCQRHEAYTVAWRWVAYGRGDDILSKRDGWLSQPQAT